MESVNVFCKNGHLLCSVKNLADACYVENAQDGVVSYPAQKEIHLPQCCRCVADEEMEKIEQEVARG